MKTTEHVEHLLRQGRKPKELLGLGFPKNVITRVRRKLREEKDSQLAATSKREATAESESQTTAVLVEPPRAIVETLKSVDRKFAELEDRLSAIDAARAEYASLEDVNARLAGTPGVGVRNRFKCECGASGFVAIPIQCTKCGRQTWWGWYPKK